MFEVVLVMMMMVDQIITSEVTQTIWRMIFSDRLNDDGNILVEWISLQGVDENLPLHDGRMVLNSLHLLHNDILIVCFDFHAGNPSF